MDVDIRRCGGQTSISKGNFTVTSFKTVNFSNELWSDVLQHLDRFSLDNMELVSRQLRDAVIERYQQLAVRVVESVRFAHLILNRRSTFTVTVKQNNSDLFPCFGLQDTDLCVVMAGLFGRLGPCVIRGKFTLTGESSWMLVHAFGTMIHAYGSECIVAGSVEFAGNMTSLSDVLAAVAGFKCVASLYTQNVDDVAALACSQLGIPYAIGSAQAGEIIDICLGMYERPLQIRVIDKLRDDDIIAMLVEWHVIDDDATAVDLEIEYMEYRPSFAAYAEQKDGSSYRFTNDAGISMTVESTGSGLRILRNTDL